MKKIASSGRPAFRKSVTRVAAGTVDHGVRLITHRRQERRGGGEGDGHQQGLRVDAEGVSAGDRDRNHQHRGRVVGDHLGEDSGPQIDRGQQGIGAVADADSAMPSPMWAAIPSFSIARPSGRIAASRKITVQSIAR